MTAPARRGTSLAMRPEGLAGRLFGRVMERMNTPAYGRAVACLGPAEGERFLEIGFGTGRLVELLLGSAPGVRVAGVDPAPTMLEVAKGRRGVRGAGEIPIIPPMAAVANAIEDAVGLRLTSLPMSPPKVLHALDNGG